MKDTKVSATPKTIDDLKLLSQISYKFDQLNSLMYMLEDLTFPDQDEDTHSRAVDFYFLLLEQLDVLRNDFNDIYITLQQQVRNGEDIWKISEYIMKDY